MPLHRSRQRGTRLRTCLTASRSASDEIVVPPVDISDQRERVIASGR
ncbi:MAG: hypothetical protein LBQ54_04465 [Planctomycetaceae bacterium]|nr:hypothetical protein [Planctomycetaceae bacterium]